MRLTKYLIVICLPLLLINCGNGSGSKNTGLAINLNTKRLQLNDTLNLTINNPKNLSIESVSYALSGKSIEANEVLNEVKLGRRQLSATVTYDGGKSHVISKNIEIFNNEVPRLLKFTVVNTYPHDITSYTLGLEFYNGELYESTGKKGQSKLRKVDYKTGEVLQNVNLADNYFGEGLTILNNKLYQLTWQSEVGFVYDVNTLKKESTFKYGSSKEGWGLCNDGKNLYKSDGTDKIWTLNPENLTEVSAIQAYREKTKIKSLNELEWVDGKIYANIYTHNGVAVINPKNGAVEAVVDFSPLHKQVKQHPELDVLNGIAYHPERKTFFVTGKNWDKLFEVTINK